MMHIPRRMLTIIITAVVAVTMIGTMVGAFVAFVPEQAGGGSKVPEATPSPPTPIPQPTVDPRSAMAKGLTLTLTDIRKSTDPKGVEVTLEVANQTGSVVGFNFFPARDISLSDDIGSNYNFRWAEYNGELKVEAGQKARLVRAFFAGPDRDASPERLMLTVARMPQIGKATWDITWPAASTRPTAISAAIPTPPAEGEKPANGLGSMITQNKVSVTLASAEVSSQPGGVTVILAVLNNGAGDLAFPFSPERSLAVVDNRGSKFNLKWAEYAGNVSIGRGQQVRLVRAFFEGPISDPQTAILTISLAGIPEFGGASWQVPVGR